MHSAADVFFAAVGLLPGRPDIAEAAELDTPTLNGRRRTNVSL